ncbi:hypothetical protein D3C87_1750470 [compost metagenome]
MLGPLCAELPDGVDFVVKRMLPVGDQVKLGAARRDLDAIGALWKQIDHRCAKQRELFAVDLAGQIPGRL